LERTSSGALAAVEKERAVLEEKLANVE